MSIAAHSATFGLPEMKQRQVMTASDVFRLDQGINPTGDIIDTKRQLTWVN
jgi:hypothetical protein|tara:strand:+ start:355 stop:507 length:153 start_codon:yes stop_codon:yes gene_type:complete